MKEIGMCDLGMAEKVNRRQNFWRLEVILSVLIV